MLFGPNIKYFNELEINGEHVDDSDSEDFTSAKHDDVADENDEAATDDDLVDFTEEEFDDDSEDAGATTGDSEDSSEDTDDITNEDDLNDFTEDEFDDPETEDEASEDNPVDTNDSAGEDDLADFTEEEFDDDSEDAGATTGDSEDSSEDTDDSSNNNSEESTDGEDKIESNDDDNTLANMEKNLFSDLSPQQLAIKNNELLQNYIELYETTNTIFDSVNKIPKTFNNTRTLSFIADQLVNLKDMINYIITTTYVTRTYVENMTYYKQALVILEQINSMLKTLVQKSTK